MQQAAQLGAKFGARLSAQETMRGTLSAGKGDEKNDVTEDLANWKPKLSWVFCCRRWCMVSEKMHAYCKRRSAILLWPP